MREVKTLTFKDLTRKNNLSEGWSWFKFNNVGLTLDMALKFYTNMVKELKLKVRKFWGLIPMFVDVVREILVGVGGERDSASLASFVNTVNITNLICNTVNMLV